MVIGCVILYDIKNNSQFYNFNLKQTAHGANKIVDCAKKIIGIYPYKVRQQ